MKHATIMAEIPRILKELEVPSCIPRDLKIEGAEDVVYRLCCEDSLDLMAKEFGSTPARVYSVMQQVFTQKFAE